MSRSNNTELVSPATKFFEWNGEIGEVNYFDKSIGEKGEKVSVAFPFPFLVLDRLTQITGGLDRGDTFVGFWSNAVRNIKTQPFTVRSKQGVETTGLYEQIKGHPGVKFMTGLYIAFYDQDRQLQIGYLKLKGSSLTAWIEFTKSHRDIYAGAFQITGKTEKKKGKTIYFEPVFEFISKVSEDSEAKAIELDKSLQEYLTAYFAQAATPDEAPQFAAAASASADFPTHSGGFDPSKDEEDYSDVPF